MNTRIHAAGLLALALLAATAVSATGRQKGATELPPAVSPEERMRWFEEARFGMFVHWGLYAVPAGEWEGNTDYGEWIMLQAKIPAPEYERFAARFNPVRFDAREWVRTAKAAGMKYLVVTAKHHDGFAMYESALTGYDIVDATPYRRDPLKALAAECRRQGIRFCVYYSVPDWHHPDFPAKYSQRGFHGAPSPRADLDRYVAYMEGQVRELLTNYGPVGIMWFDGGGSFRDVPNRAELVHAEEILAMIRQLQPRCIVNNRLGIPADYGTPEQHIPGEAPKEAFEVCMTLNRHWGYNARDQDWKSPEQVIRNLVDIASKGGNYLLNVGPTAEGVIPAESTRILAEVGRWLDRNGEAIYGTTASPLPAPPAWGRVTRKGRTLYLHVFDWPADGRLNVMGLAAEPGRAYLLADRTQTPLRMESGGAGELRLQLPPRASDPIASVVVLEAR